MTSTAQAARSCDEVLAEVSKAVVGKQGKLALVLAGILAGGHVLIEDNPGLAKTLAARSFAQALGLQFRRVQFTPDLLPSDITGSYVYDQSRNEFAFRSGPLFTGLLLADEINRTPPKTQAALLEAMQERQVTVAGQRHKLPDPFFVLATQNPIEQEGTYPLPEAQQDRFMFDIRVSYPSEDEEYNIIEATTSPVKPRVERVVSGAELLAMQELVLQVPAAPHVMRYATRLVRTTRPAPVNGEPAVAVPDFIKKYVGWGAGPRAGQSLILAAKARALLHGRTYVATEDVRAVAPPVLRHRVITNYNAEADGVTPDEVVRRLLQVTPRDGDKQD